MNGKRQILKSKKLIELKPCISVSSVVTDNNVSLYVSEARVVKSKEKCKKLCFCFCVCVIVLLLPHYYLVVNSSESEAANAFLSLQSTYIFKY